MAPNNSERVIDRRSLGRQAADCSARRATLRRTRPISLRKLVSLARRATDKVAESEREALLRGGTPIARGRCGRVLLLLAAAGALSGPRFGWTHSRAGRQQTDGQQTRPTHARGPRATTSPHRLANWPRPHGPAPGAQRVPEGFVETSQRQCAETAPGRGI